MDDQLAELVESAQACITALQSGSEDPDAAKEGRLETLSLTWRNLRTTLDRVLSQQEEERGRLQRVGERAEFEILSAQSHIESLKEEVRELSRSLVELREEHGYRTKDSKTQNLVPNAEESGGMECEPQTLQSDTPCTGMEHGQTTDAKYGESSAQTIHSQTIPGVESSTQAPSSGSGNGDVETQESAQPTTSDGTDSEYLKVEYAVLYYHKATGYYYDPSTLQFFMPTSASSSSSYTSDQQQTGADVQPTHPVTCAAGVSSQTGQTSETGQASQMGVGSGSGGIAAMLAAASDRVMERCGYCFDEESGMYYDSGMGLYYDPESKLYYDPELGTYYYYDPEIRQYQFHSKVKLPKSDKLEAESDQKDGLESGQKQSSDVIDLCSSSEEEFLDSPEEGEIRPPKRPKLPRGSPPPEDEWAPAIRMVVKSSEILPEGTLFIVTQDGATLGRDSSGPHGIKLPELQVSKNHAEIIHRKIGYFTISDLGSTNGTFLNEERLSEPKEVSKPHPLSHTDILTLGTTTLLLHIHTGWETCEGCDPALREGHVTSGGVAEAREPLELQRRKELNRIKKKFGLRMKDTFGREVRFAEGYKDRASVRRKVVGSDLPPMNRPDDPPSSVHRPIPVDNKGRRLLERMGWREGEGLGRGGAGRAEPVLAEVRGERAGLGSGLPSRSLDMADTQSAVRHQKMVHHFAQVMAREQTRKQQKQTTDIFSE